MLPWFTLVWLLLAVTTTAWAMMRARSSRLRFVVSLLSTALLTWILTPIVGSVLQPNYPQDLAGFGLLSAKCFVAAWWFLVARTIILGGQIALGINHQQHPARLASDLAGGVIYLGALIAIVDQVFGVSVTGLVATSGIIAIVLGLALQNTLGDLFSGIAIGIDRPFIVGDLIWIEGSIEGRVIETNWRSTRIKTASNDMATVPNSVVAKARILNRSFPTESHTRTVKIVLDPSVPPQEAISVLRGAVFNASFLTPPQKAKIVCTDLRGEGAFYEIEFSASLADIAEARSDLLQQVARHTRYAGLALAPQDGTPRIRVEAPDTRTILKEVLLLQALTDEELTQLEAGLIRHEGGPRETIFDQGGGRASMFVIARGAFEVCRDDGEGERRLGTIGPGDYFGELALLTGIANAATVRALTPFEAYEITKATIAPLLQKNPDLLVAVEAAAAKAQSLLERTIASQASPNTVPSSHLIDRIKAFFSA